nr:hypothetical protein SHINE37_30174 [Rhizobiaceae bacterium]
MRGERHGDRGRGDRRDRRCRAPPRHQRHDLDPGQRAAPLHQRVGQADAHLLDLCHGRRHPHHGRDRREPVDRRRTRPRTEMTEKALPPAATHRTAGQSHMEFNVAAFPFSPAGRRWPEGSDEGVIRVGFLTSLPSPSPSSACRHLLPAGEKGKNGNAEFHMRLPCS